MSDRSGANAEAKIHEMIIRDELRRVPRNPGFQQQLLLRANENTTVASDAADTAPSTAFVLAYDAMRHSVDAHLNSRGLRAGSGEGAHRHRADYAAAAMTDLMSQEDLDYYRAARTMRNKAEYPEPATISQINQLAATKAVDVARRFRRAVWERIRPAAPET